ncbi:hypothetical protein IAT38_007830 [Cryptococcus sp. DSM 104549]
MPSPSALVNVALAVDNYPYGLTTDAVPPVPFHLTLADFNSGLQPIGLLRPATLAAMIQWQGQSGEEVWVFHLSPNGKCDCVYFVDAVLLGNRYGISQVMDRIVRWWRDSGILAKDLKGWRNELFAVYASPRSSIFGVVGEGDCASSNIAFYLEREACPIFGVTTLSAHLIAYEGEGDDMMVWVPVRSQAKSLWPNALDCSVAGGVAAGLSPYETIIKESGEEAGLSPGFVQRYIQDFGHLSFFHVLSKGCLRPVIEYMYELPLPPQSSPDYVRLESNVDEVESFSLFSIPQIIAALHSGDIKPAKSLVYIDFLMRHGLVTSENELYFNEIRARSRRQLEVAVPW